MSDGVVARFLPGLRAGEAQAVGSLTVVPLFGPPSGPEVEPLTRAVAAGAAMVGEVCESGRVNELGVSNRGARPLLLLEGEELVGAKQNRVVTTSILVASGDAIRVPVACVEKRRWQYTSATLAPSGRRMRPDARTTTVTSISDSLRLSRAYVVDQQAVWRDVAAYARRRGVDSATMAMSDVFDRDRVKIDPAVDAIRPQPGQVGAAVYIGGVFSSLDAFGRPETYAAYHDSIVRSAAAQAIEVDAAADAKLSPPVEWVFRALAASPIQPFKPPGLGEDHRMAFGPFVGAALVAGDGVVHLSAYSST